MSAFRRDELTRLDDIEGLLITARDLARRFRSSEMEVTCLFIDSSLNELRRAKAAAASTDGTSAVELVERPEPSI